MAQPFAKFYYNGDILRYLSLMNSILAEVRIKTERGEVQVPLTVAAGRRNDLNRGQPTNILPLAVLDQDLSGLQIDKTATSSHRLSITGTSTGNTQRQRIPVTIPFGYYVKTKKTTEALQILEQMLGVFTPSMDCTVADNEKLGVQQNVKIKLINWTIENNWEGDGTESMATDSLYNFELSGYIYRDGGDGGSTENHKIEEVIVQLGQGMDVSWEQLEDWFLVNAQGVQHPPYDEEN